MNDLNDLVLLTGTEQQKNTYISLISSFGKLLGYIEGRIYNDDEEAFKVKFAKELKVYDQIINKET